MAPSLRNRKPSKPETGSDTDAGDDALDEQYARGFVKAFSNVRTQCSFVTLCYWGFNWDDEQGRTMLEAIKYAVHTASSPTGALTSAS